MAKKLTRRHFIKLSLGASLYPLLKPADPVLAEPRRYGKLIDTARCIGCKRCMSACQRWNNLKLERIEILTDRETDLSGNSYTVVNLRTDSGNTERGTYVKWQCQHCIKPACVGVCPVTAITKLPSGPVVINESKCIGCRYCFQACPFKVPRFDFEKRVTRKCHLCYNRTPLLNYMKPACVAACPVGAMDFDYKDVIVREAKRRVERGRGGSHIMGLVEAGGTDVLTILPASPRKMGLVVAPNKVVNQNLDKLRITASGFLGASVIAGGMYIYAHTTRGLDEKDHEREK